ncbi:MAG: type 1 glutamine amidotransferase [Pseudomonadota bacterium]
MTKILIVEGNSGEIIRTKHENGLKIGSDKYHEAMALYTPDTEFDVSIPFEPDMQNNEIRIEDYNAFALTGSGVDWSSRDKEAKPYLDHVEKILATGKPVIGSCWGMQTVVQILGGNCGPNENGTEVGLAEDIRLSAEGRAHWIFEGMPDSFPSPCVHRDHVAHLPECFDLLAGNSVSPVQAACYNREDIDFVGFQFHPEFDLDYVQSMRQSAEILPGTHKIIANFPDNPPEIVSNAGLRTRVVSNWISHVQNKKAASGIAA